MGCVIQLAGAADDTSVAASSTAQRKRSRNQTELETPSLRGDPLCKSMHKGYIENMIENALHT